MNSDFFKNAANDRRILWNSKNDFRRLVPVSNHDRPSQENSEQKDICGMIHSPKFHRLFVPGQREPAVSTGTDSAFVAHGLPGERWRITHSFDWSNDKLRRKSGGKEQV